MIDDLDELGDAEVGDNTERSNELEGSPGEDASNSWSLGGSTPNMVGNSGVPGAASNDAPNPGGGYILSRNARASSAVDSAVDISSDTSQEPHKTMQFSNNARKPRKLDLGSRPAFQLPKNRPQALSGPTQ